MKRLGSSFLRNSSLVFVGNLLNSGLSFLTLIAVSRSLSASEFGYFSVATGVLFLAAEMSDLGINAGLIRFVAQYLREEQQGKVRDIIAYTLRSRLQVALIVIVGGLLLAQPLAVPVFHAASILK